MAWEVRGPRENLLLLHVVKALSKYEYLFRHMSAAFSLARGLSLCINQQVMMQGFITGLQSVENE